MAEVAENWLRRHVEKNKHRTAGEMRRHVDKYILPYWRDRIFVEIRRSDIAALLDMIEDKHGAGDGRRDPDDAALNRRLGAEAGRRLYHRLSSGVCGASQSRCTIARGCLSDDELRRVWSAAGEMGQFGAFVRLLLLTAQRRDKVAHTALGRYRRQRSFGRSALRNARKGNPGTAATAQARSRHHPGAAALRRQPICVRRARTGHALCCRNSDSKIEASMQSSGVTDWRLHDLRRTARSLMSRAGVLSEHAERVLGHAIDGVEGIYNRHDYDAEKADALRKLAALVERIVSPPAENVRAPRTMRGRSRWPTRWQSAGLL